VEAVAANPNSSCHFLWAWEESSGGLQVES
jgi:hypothetical protein